MNSASADKKLDAVVAVVAKLVEQRKALHEQMQKNFGDEFVEFGILTFQFKLDIICPLPIIPFNAGRLRALFLVLVGRFGLSSIFGKNGG